MISERGSHGTRECGLCHRLSRNRGNTVERCALGSRAGRAAEPGEKASEGTGPSQPPDTDSPQDASFGPGAENFPHFCYCVNAQYCEDALLP